LADGWSRNGKSARIGIALVEDGARRTDHSPVVVVKDIGGQRNAAAVPLAARQLPFPNCSCRGDSG
jgi:hypothetical protein